MARQSEKISESERMREVIRLLELALEDCERYLGTVEETLNCTKQDNDPPHVR
jgi:hypothetical protein